MLKRLDPYAVPATFDLLAFLEGETYADGAFEDRSGRLRRRFTAETVGRLDGQRLILDESFHFDDGEEMQRSWTLQRGANGAFAGTCADAPLPARGTLDPDRATMKSTLLLTVGTRKIAMSFDDVFYPVDSATVLNRSIIRKWGVTIGQVLMVFRKA